MLQSLIVDIHWDGNLSSLNTLLRKTLRQATHSKIDHGKVVRVTTPKVQCSNPSCYHRIITLEYDDGILIGDEVI